MATASSNRLRARLVDELRRQRALESERIAQAFLAVPRELFLPELAEEQGLQAVYKNAAVPTKKDRRGIAISSSSEPAIMALMLEKLQLAAGQRVLEIGAGTGYNAALIDTIVGRSGKVVTVDIEPDITRKAKTALRKGGFKPAVQLADGRRGFPRFAPYDRIIVTASSTSIPRAWVRQLRPGGILVMPLRLAESVFWPQAVVAFERVGNGLESRSVIPGGFMGLRGPEEPAPEFGSVVYAGAQIGGKNLPFGNLSGRAIDRLSRPALKKLAALLASEERMAALEKSARRYDLEVFIAVREEDDVLVTYRRKGRSSLAICDPNDGSLAAFDGKQRVTGLVFQGGSKAERLLRGALKEWERRSRPRPSQLMIHVSFDKQSRDAWRVKERGSSVLLFTWT